MKHFALLALGYLATFGLLLAQSPTFQTAWQHAGTPGALGQVELLDAQGRMVFAMNTPASSLVIPLPESVKGVHVLRVRNTSMSWSSSDIAQ
jgi:hypothetical protein